MNKIHPLSVFLSLGFTRICFYFVLDVSSYVLYPILSEVVKKKGYCTVRLTVSFLWFREKCNFLDDHLQEASSSGLSFLRGWSLRIIICNHEKGMKNAFWDPSQWDKMCFEYYRNKFQWKEWVNIFTFAYGQDRRSWPPPLTVSLTVKYPFLWLPTIISESLRADKKGLIHQFCLKFVLTGI